jgi:hypothetical protein
MRYNLNFTKESQYDIILVSTDNSKFFCSRYILSLNSKVFKKIFDTRKRKIDDELQINYNNQEILAYLHLFHVDKKSIEPISSLNIEDIIQICYLYETLWDDCIYYIKNNKIPLELFRIIYCYDDMCNIFGNKLFDNIGFKMCGNLPTDFYQKYCKYLLDKNQQIKTKVKLIIQNINQKIDINYDDLFKD